MSENGQGKRETLADIVREKRIMAAEIRANLSNVPVRRDDQLLEADSLDREADRIEAAWKREKAEIEADALAVGGIVEAARHKPGNAAAMREALENIAEYAETARCHTDDAHVLGYLEQIEKWAESAISAPARQCDVDTAEEQEKRWHKNCGHGIPNCKNCKVYGQGKESGLVGDRGFLRCSCRFIWAQMPYDAQEGGEK